MRATARTLHWRPAPNAVADTQHRIVLLQQLAYSGLIGASATIAGTRDAASWSKLEACAEAFLETNKALAGTFQLEDWNVALIEQAVRVLRHHGDQPAADYVEMTNDLRGRLPSWIKLAPVDEVDFCVHAAVVWHTIWHLLAAGVSVRHAIGLLKFVGDTRNWAKSDTSTAPGSGEIATQSAARTVGPFARRLTDAGVRGLEHVSGHIAVVRQRRAVARTARRAAEAERQKLIASRRLAAIEAERTFVPSPPPAKPSADGAKPVMALDGRRLRSSVFGTWLLLVLLSWVSLIWGTLISAPFSGGMSILVSLFVGIIGVPIWGTFWGFVGMSNAASNTLRHMEFKPLAQNDPLRVTAERFSGALGIPCPTLGTINVHNAFAMGVHESYATVAMGRPLLAQLSEAEAAAVLGHELGHVVSGDMRSMMLARTFQNACVWFGMFQGLKQFARWMICWAAELCILSFSRRREYYADAIGAALAGKEAMIGALGKLQHAPALTAEENTHARFMFRGRIKSALSTHPSFEQRIAALQQETYLRRLPTRRG